MSSHARHTSPLASDAPARRDSIHEQALRGRLETGLGRTPAVGAVLPIPQGARTAEGPSRSGRDRREDGPRGRSAGASASPSRLAAPAKGAGAARGVEPTHAEIAAEAYRIWLEHGGNSVVNWLEAESRLRRSRGLHGA